MRLAKHVREGEMRPTLYAYAYRDFDRDIAIYYPIVFNVLVRYGRDAWHWFLYKCLTKRSYVDRLAYREYWRGYNAAQRALGEQEWTGWQRSR